MMFRFKEFSLHYWDCWDRVRINLDGDIVVVTGVNGSGKSTLLDALRLLVGFSHFPDSRPLRNYVHQGRAIIYAVVSNTAAQGSQRPFAPEGVTADEATIACAVILKSSGELEKRYQVFAGRPELDALLRFFLERNKGVGPRAWDTVMANAGVTEGFLNVLGIGQGGVGAFAKQTPGQLFHSIMDLLGDKRTIEGFSQAKTDWETFQRETIQLEGELATQRSRLSKISQQVDLLDEWEQVETRIEDLGKKIPAAKLQRLLSRKRESETQLPARTRQVEQAETSVRAHRERLQVNDRGRAQLQQELTARREEAQECLRRLRKLESERGGLAAAIETLERQTEELQSIPPADLKALESEREDRGRALFSSEREKEELESVVAGLGKEIGQLEAGLPVYPEKVQRTLDELRARGIHAGLACETLEPADPSQIVAIESALGNARFSLIVERDDEDAALEVARSNAFPGPVYAGARLAKAGVTGALRGTPGAAAGLLQWIESVQLEPDGVWRDQRGRWPTPVNDRFLGKESLRAALEVAQRRKAQAEETLRDVRAHVLEHRQRLERLDEQIERQRRRRDIEEAIQVLPDKRASLGRVDAGLQDVEKLHRVASEGVERIAGRDAHLDAERGGLEKEIKRLESEKAGAEKSAVELRDFLNQFEAEAAPLISILDAKLVEAANRGDLDPQEEYEEQLKAAERHIRRLDPKPYPSVREEQRILKDNVDRSQRGLSERASEQERFLKALNEARGEYVNEANLTLVAYRERALELAKLGGLRADITVPVLLNDDKSVAEASITVRLGFDQKDPVPIGHSSLSGGQRVVAGLLIITAMADTEGRGFFIFDEPYQGLSVDRIDLVSDFIESVGCQFVITEPTTGDLSILEAADIQIALEVQRPNEPFAPRPRSAVRTKVAI